MDKKQWHRQLIREIYEENISIPFENRDLKLQAVYDEAGDHYLIMVFGIDKERWKHFCLTHIDLIDDKIVIQCDGNYTSMAEELWARGVPESDVEQAFRIDLKETARLKALWLEKKQWEKEESRELAGVA